MNQREFGARLRSWRRGADLTQEKVAKSIGISIPAFGRAENGLNYLAPENLSKLNEIYGLNINWLLTGKGEMLEPKGNGGRIIPLVAWDEADPMLSDELHAEVLAAIEDARREAGVVLDYTQNALLVRIAEKMAASLGRPVKLRIIEWLFQLAAGPDPDALKKLAERAVELVRNGGDEE